MGKVREKGFKIKDYVLSVLILGRAAVPAYWRGADAFQLWKMCCQRRGMGPFELDLRRLV